MGWQLARYQASDLQEGRVLEEPTNDFGGQETKGWVKYILNL